MDITDSKIPQTSLVNEPEVPPDNIIVTKITQCKRPTYFNRAYVSS